MRRHLALDLVRGLAAASVAVYHWLYYSRHVDVQSAGTFSVYMFFVLSALAMALVYGPAFSKQIGYADAADFFRNRAARLMPLLALVSLVSFAYSLHGGVLGREDIARLVLTGTGALSLAMPGLTSGVTGTWTLGIELGFYLIVPLLLLWVAKVRWTTILWTGVALVALQQIYFQLLDPIAEPTGYWRFYIQPLTFAPFFIAGFLIYKLGQAATSPLWLLLVIPLFAASVGYSLLNPTQLFHDHWSYLLCSLLAAGTIYAAWRTKLPKALELPARRLGDASYALYLTHPFVFEAVHRFGFPPLTEFAVFIGAALATALATFFMFERPARDWLRIHTGGKASAAAEFVTTLP